MTGTRFIRAQPHECREAGFTLLELLVSLMILALIFSFFPGALSIGKRVWETDEAFEKHAALSSFRRYVENRLSEAMPIYRRDSAARLQIEFTGEPDRLTFIAPAAAGPGGGGVYRFQLQRDETGGFEKLLVLKQSLYRPQHVLAGPEPEGKPVPAEIYRPDVYVEAMNFRYFGPSRGKQTPRWLDRWTQSDSLPQLVEISFVPGNGKRKIERLIVPLRLGAAQ